MNCERFDFVRFTTAPPARIYPHPRARQGGQAKRSSDAPRRPHRDLRAARWRARERACREQKKSFDAQRLMRPHARRAATRFRTRDGTEISYPARGAVEGRKTFWRTRGEPIACAVLTEHFLPEAAAAAEPTTS